MKIRGSASNPVLAFIITQVTQWIKDNNFTPAIGAIAVYHPEHEHQEYKYLVSYVAFGGQCTNKLQVGSRIL
ncbi:MAG TPA: hypothetical protein VK203_10790 [Nostocaceae cyanobacterium]|nr:hypothetical protein [Nostocaceae cyanobacterium]